MVKCLPGLTYFTVFLKNKNIIFKFRRSKVTEYAALKISQMFQFCIKEKFDVLRMFRFLVSSRYRRVRKMQLHLVLFALFNYTIFKEDNAPVICIHGPHLRG